MHEAIAASAGCSTPFASSTRVPTVSTGSKPTTLVVGALSVIRRAKQLGYTRHPWLTRLMERWPVKIAAVALTNKIARTAWALMARNESHRPPLPA